MSGFVSILERPHAVPHLQRLVDEIKDVPLDSLTPEHIRARSADASGDTVPERDTASLSMDEPAAGREAVAETSPVVARDTVPRLIVEAAPVRGTVSFSTPDPKHKIRKCVMAQDGHSLGEEALYQALWNARIARFETKESKLITAGWKVMSHLARLTPRNTKNNCQSLIEKLALDLVHGESSAERIGRTYRVHSYKAILERRKAAGLEWVIRTRGVQFVDAPPQSLKRTTLVERDTVPLQDTVIEKGTRQRAAPVPFPALVTLLTERLGFAEEGSVSALVQACRQHAPDAAEDEIVHFTSAKLELAARMRNIQNPMGFLLTAVPRCFEGAAFEHYREAERMRKQAEAQKEAALREEMEFYRKQQQAVLDDPAATGEDKDIARSILAGFAD